jgi:hypothetical protein
MKAEPSPLAERIGLALAAAVLAAAGWAGLYGLVFYVDPRIGPLPLWAFFLTWMLALTGTAVPFAHFLNRRFSRRPTPAYVVMRQSLWFGCFGATCAWLQRSGFLSAFLVVLLALVLTILEVVLRLREGSRWNPIGSPPSDLPDEPA